MLKQFWSGVFKKDLFRLADTSTQNSFGIFSSFNNNPPIEWVCLLCDSLDGIHLSTCCVVFDVSWERYWQIELVCEMEAWELED